MYIEPEDEKAELYRKFIENVRYQERIANRLEELIAPVRAVKS